LFIALMSIRLITDGRLGCPSRGKAIEISEQRTIVKKLVLDSSHNGNSNIVLKEQLLFLSASPDISTLRYSSSNLYHHLRYPSNRP
ncbi:hypothetical protein T4C_10642, partial [Trichinella pseudospiralis]